MSVFNNIKRNLEKVSDYLNLTNSGGVIVSYCEWVQNKTGHIFSRQYMENILKEKLTHSFNETQGLYDKEKGFSMRNAAYVIAIRKILSAEKSRSNL